MATTGGAWTIGYKAWGALLGRRLSEGGILVASMDYRNFPQVMSLPSQPLSKLMQGSCQDMLEDVNNGIAWVLRCIHRFGGDPKKVYLCGQSAGGHLTATAMLTQARHSTLFIIYIPCTQRSKEGLMETHCWREDVHGILLSSVLSWESLVPMHFLI